MLKGVDISAHNGNVDFDALAEAVDFVILRACVGTKEDAKFRENYRSATAAGIPVGAYQYAMWQIAPENEVLALAGIAQGLDLPAGLWYDVEDPGFHGMTAAARTTMTERGLESLRGHTGEGVGLYCSYGWYKSMYNPKRTDLWDYPLWIADWDADHESRVLAIPNATIWQYNNKGSVPGVPTIVDENSAPEPFFRVGMKPCGNPRIVAAEVRPETRDQILKLLEATPIDGESYWVYRKETPTARDLVGLEVFALSGGGKLRKITETP